MRAAHAAFSPVPPCAHVWVENAPAVISPSAQRTGPSEPAPCRASGGQQPGPRPQCLWDLFRLVDRGAVLGSLTPAPERQTRVEFVPLSEPHGTQSNPLPPSLRLLPRPRPSGPPALTCLPQEHPACSHPRLVGLFPCVCLVCEVFLCF